MRNKIIRTSVRDPGPCVCCGQETSSMNYEKAHREKNSAYVCDDCNCVDGELKLEIKRELFYCPDCEETVTNPAKGAGGLLVCPNDFCGAVVRKKE